MADTDALRQYTVGNSPTLPNSDKRYLADQLTQVSQSLNTIVRVMKQLEARMTAHGI